MKIYVASSWKNDYQPFVVKQLRSDGHEVYDFRTEAAFSWKVIDENWRSWTVEEYINYLNHPKSVEGFNSDFGGVQWCDAGVLVLPCGLSAGIEAGLIKGFGKKVVVYVPQIREAELMIKAFDAITDSIEEISVALGYAHERSS